MLSNEFIDAVKKTESKVDRVSPPIVMLAKAMDDFISASDRLDRIKKYCFYGKDVDWGQAEVCPTLGINPRVFHAIIGKATEAGELLSALHEAVFLAMPLDLTNLAEEVADGWWYDGVLIDECGWDVEKMQQMLIAKLQKRYPEGFTEKDAQERDLEGEREVLDGHLSTSTETYCWHKQNGQGWMDAGSYACDERSAVAQCERLANTTGTTHRVVRQLDEKLIHTAWR